MIRNSEIRKIYSELQKQLFYLIPERWDKIYLYASVEEKMKGLETGELFFYYFPRGILKKNPVNVYEIPNKFSLNEEEYIKAKNIYYEIGNNIDLEEYPDELLEFLNNNNKYDANLFEYIYNSFISDRNSIDMKLLENYLNEEYYYNHDDITLKTIDNTYNYKIFSVYIATTNLQHVNLNFTDDEYYEHLNWLKSNSIYDTGVTIEPNNEILVLQTCYFGIDNSYVIIAAKKI